MADQCFDSIAESVRLMDTLLEGLVLLDNGQKVLAVNRSGAAYLQLLAQAGVGDMLSHLGGQSVQTLLTPLPSGTPHHEIAIERPSPHVFEVITYSIQGGEAWLLVLLNTTELRQMQALAQQQDRLAVVGQLAAGIAHDFNNILMPILLYTDLVMSSLPPTSEAHFQLGQVLRAARRAKELVMQIQTFSHRPVQAHDATPVQPIILEVIHLLNSVLPPTIEIRQLLDPRVGPVLADPTQIHQILMNLCTNAYHAMRAQGGVLTVGLDAIEVDARTIAQFAPLKEGRYVRLTVSDTGHGMDQDIRQRIFDPFFTTKPVGEGTGMGLAVVYGIVKSNGGVITVESELGHGSTFCVCLPQANSRAESDAEVEQPVLRGSERILVVDDEKAIAFVIQETLENLGYSVTAQTNSVEALAIFRAAPERFDLMITDLTMPRLTGSELLAEVLHSRPDLPVVLIIGMGETLTPDVAQSLGFRAHLMKPFGADDLNRTIRRVLDEDESDGRG